MPEEVLIPADPSKVAGLGTGLATGASPATPSGGPGPASPGGTGRAAKHERREERKASAQARQNSNDLRKRVQKLERQLEKVEAEVAELEAQLGDPEIYDRPEEVHRLATLHEEAKAKAVEVMAEWEIAAEQLEG